MTIKEKVKNAVKALDDKKALDIRVIEIGDLTTVADYFVVATGSSSTHVKALADEVEYQMTQAGVEPDHIEGRSTGWILLDYLDFVVHVFLGESREYYNLERLWSDAKEVDISDFITE
ncbi:MAG: ribosome silencing factor [Clostridiales bacterium]|nr:ribosome silencing factor [Clostridiales bacterium]